MSETQHNVLLIEDRENFRLLTLNRPQRRNALSPDLVDDLTRALKEADADRNVRVVVITGAEGFFCAGGDLSGPAGDGFFEQHQERASFADLLLTFRRMAKPTIAAVNGHALGGGFGIVLSCDLAVANKDALLGTPEVLRGLFPMMIAALIYEQMPRKAANEMVLLGQRLSADRARELGVVNQVTDDVMHAVHVLALDLSHLSTSVLQLGKRAIANQLDMPFEQKLMFLRDQLTLNLQLEDAAEGVSAFLEKRDPQWKGR